jgi:hypothetical protein
VTKRRWVRLPSCCAGDRRQLAPDKCQLEQKVTPDGDPRPSPESITRSIMRTISLVGNTRPERHAPSGTHQVQRRGAPIGPGVHHTARAWRANRFRHGTRAVHGPAPNKPRIHGTRRDRTQSRGPRTSLRRQRRSRGSDRITISQPSLNGDLRPDRTYSTWDRHGRTDRPRPSLLVAGQGRKARLRAGLAPRSRVGGRPARGGPGRTR